MLKFYNIFGLLNFINSEDKSMYKIIYLFYFTATNNFINWN
jgi:hypothetical protein